VELADVTLETFEPQLGTTFELEVSDAEGARHVLGLELSEAASSPAPPGDRGRPPFTLLFRGPADLLLPQATYALAHAELGTVEIFIVPIGHSVDGVDYQAVFT
jgi:hypothetical protein